MKLISLVHKIPFLHQLFPQERFVYVAIGDSTVEGIGASSNAKTYPSVIYSALKNSFNIVEYHNLGKSGAKIVDVLESQVEKAVSAKPNLITISIGANDIFKRKGKKYFEVHLDMLLNKLKTETTATIVINTIPDFSALPSIPPVLKTYCKIQGVRFNTIIINVSVKHEVILVDFYTQTKILGKKYPEIISADGLHPSDIGYAIWAHAVLVKIEHILEKKTGVDVKTETLLIEGDQK